MMYVVYRGVLRFAERLTSIQIEMMERNGTCQTLCTTNVPPEDSKFINDRIKEDYALNWLIDGLPAAEMKKDIKTNETFFDMGFNLGNDEEDYAEQPTLNNNYDIYIRCVAFGREAHYIHVPSGQVSPTYS